MLSRAARTVQQSHNHHTASPFGMDGQKSDREHEMIKNRIILVVLAWSACAILGASPGLVVGFGVYFALSIAIAIAYLMHRKPSVLRRFIGLATDCGVGTFLFYIGGENAAAFYPLLLWVILGNGFRFGVPWLFLAAAMETIGFAWVAFTVEFWRSNPALSVGLVVGLMVIPAYCSTLITKISLAKEEAEAASKAKSLFLASISHELRTPLNAIIGYGTHLLDMKLPDKQHQMIATSVSAGRHLLYLINQLLSFAQSDSREELPDPKTFSLVDLLSEVRDIMQIGADEKNLKIVLQAEPGSDRSISGQADYIRNILINLTGNAVKFTASGSITLRCGFVSDSEDQMWLSVTDTGPGIAKEAQQKIFNVFHQANDEIANEFGGTGLGLAICQKLAGQMGGHISVHSDLGAGSTFTVSFPVEIPKAVNICSDGETIRILSLTRNDHPPVIGNTENQSVVIDHVRCDQSEDIAEIIRRRDEISYDIALVDEAIAADHSDESPLWEAFREARLPPVLFAAGNRKSLKDLQLRAAFATLLPAGSDFSAIRSAVQIGCSFAERETDTAAETRDDGQPTAVSPVRVLIADDNRTNQMVLETILTNAGHTVVVASDGEQALDRLESEKFDIVFLDVNMPVMGGIECCRLWRQIEGPRQHVPIIGLTADSTEETEKKCLDAGMDLRLTKPIEAGELIDIITSQTETGDSDAITQDVPDPLGVISKLDGTNELQDRPAIDPAQLEYLLSIGDEAFVQSIIEAYLEDASQILAAFRKSVEAGSVDDFRFHAHAFKSGAANIGAVRLVEICSTLEVIREPDFEDRRFAYLEQVERQVADVRSCLYDITTSSRDDQMARKSVADPVNRQTARRDR